MLIFEVRKFSESTYKKMRNPAKLYPVDTGLCRRTTSLDQGRLLENLVFLELKRKGQEVFYLNEKIKCYFIARDEDESSKDLIIINSLTFLLISITITGNTY